ncbi:hypothetical protein KQX54_017454 [Cotesia glomerata]|uniref:Uncharacterized protein n=1 Tax=Cotesia glomerata TaxID=32391 RepID=A0AAV7IJB0_COTGL|nr:hypothetical protein KQX54_017454 [Cotesia glomerata]
MGVDFFVSLWGQYKRVVPVVLEGWRFSGMFMRDDVRGGSGGFREIVIFWYVYGVNTRLCTKIQGVNRNHSRDINFFCLRDEVRGGSGGFKGMAIFWDEVWGGSGGFRGVEIFL